MTIFPPNSSFLRAFSRAFFLMSPVFQSPRLRISLHRVNWKEGAGGGSSVIASQPVCLRGEKVRLRELGF